MITQKEDIAVMGRGGYGFADGNQTWLWWVLIVLFIFIFLFRGRDGEHHRGHHEYGDGYGCGHVKGQRPVFYDESNYEEERNLNKEICKEGEKTRALIELNYREQANRDFQKQLIETSELKGKINTLEIEKNIDSRLGRLFGEVRSDYQKLACEIGALPKAAPCFIPTRTIPTCEPCTVPSRHDFGGCGCN